MNGHKIALLTSGGLSLMITACETPKPPDPPILISPEPGAVFETEPPTFCWSHDSRADGYLLDIKKYDALVFSTLLEDTLYTLSAETFDSLDNGAYLWQVSARWIDEGTLDTLPGEEREFKVAGNARPSLDLDTTYYPFGMGHQWSYERKTYEHTFTHEGGDWDTTYYDTLVTVITDSTYEPDGWKFTGGINLDMAVEEFVVLEVDNSYMVPLLWDTFDIEPVVGNYTSDYGTLKIRYVDDTLAFEASYDDGIDQCTHATWRVKGLGPVRQYYEETRGYPYTLKRTYSLLYFYNGEDTIKLEHQAS